MTMWRKRWRIAPPAPQVLFERFQTLNPLVVQVLYNRGITASEEVQRFFEGVVPDDNPFRIRGVSEAVSLIRRTIEADLAIAVYGDYDADGVTATAILVQTLRALGGRVEAYIPDRIEEGYGLNAEAVTALADKGIRLLITVDCGIRSLEEVALARARGIQTVITDHHHVGPALPPADAVINPRRPDSPYPFPDLAGAGVAFKLAQALLRVNRRVPLATIKAEGRELLAAEELLDLVALGTIADMVPLVGENHVLVKRGLERINHAPRPGLRALMQICDVEPGKVTARTISFVLAPRVNAAGRIGEALTAFELLVAPDLASALPLAQDLETLNQERRALTHEVRERARTMVLDVDDNPPLLFAASPEFPAGIVGLAASRLLEEFYRPVVVVEEGEEFSKGSARSIPEFHITEALDRVSDLLVRYGGHAAAAGFTVRTENLEELQRRLVDLAREELAEVVLTPSLLVDAELPLNMLSWDLHEDLEALAPFGYGNRSPTLVSRDVRILSARAVGAEGRHLKLYVADEQGRSWSAIAFRQGAWIGRLPDVVDLAYHLQRNEWNGRTTLQLNVLDIHPQGMD
ncbi:MAG: single-stranded-DNA-specific exonuclease RecJ [Anaerolineae bacterium]